MTYSDRAVSMVYRIAVALTAVALAVSLALIMSATSPRRWDIHTGRIWTECEGQGVSLPTAHHLGCDVPAPYWGR